MTVYADTIVNLANTQAGGRYLYGGKASPSDPNPKADGHPLDCSGLITWAVDRAGGYIPDGSVQQEEYCREHGTLISVEEARVTLGALLFIRTAEDQHVVMTAGPDLSIEAKGSAYGIGHWSEAGDYWTAAARIPGVYYGAAPIAPPPGGTAAPRMLYLTDPMMHGTDVEAVQRVVGLTGSEVDGWYGPQSEGRVVAWQRTHGLSPDGIVGPLTRAAMRI